MRTLQYIRYLSCSTLQGRTGIYGQKTLAVKFGKTKYLSIVEEKFLENLNLENRNIKKCDLWNKVHKDTG